MPASPVFSASLSPGPPSPPPPPPHPQALVVCLRVFSGGGGVLVSMSMPSGPLSPRTPICVPAVGPDLGASAWGPQGYQPASELVRSLPSLDSPPC